MSRANSPRVFVSYSSKDKTWAEQIIQALEQSGIRCWYAPRDITAGAEWGSAIVDAITECDAMIVVFSDKTNHSSHVRREVERAISKSLPLLPIRIENCQPTGALDYALSNTHWLDAFQPPLEKRLGELVDAAQKLTDGGTPREVSVDSGASSMAAEPVRNRRAPLFVGAVALVAVLLVAGEMIRRNSLGEHSTAQEADETTPLRLEPVDAKGETFVDKTSEFQGRWRVVREYLPTRGFFLKKEVDGRGNTWVFDGETLTTLRRPTKKTRAGSHGTVSIRSTPTESHFDFKGVDMDGRRQRWVGAFAVSESRLRVWYRPQFNFMEQLPERPVPVPVSEQPNVAFVELVRR